MSSREVLERDTDADEEDETDAKGEETLRVTEARSISSAKDRISSREVLERDIDAAEVLECGGGEAMLAIQTVMQD